MPHKEDENNIDIMGTIGWEVDATEVIDQINSGTGDLTLHIFSGGGSAFHGFAIYDALIATERNVTAKIYGLAASAASVIAMGADTIEMGDGGFIMIHEAWTVAIGEADDLRKDAELLDKLNDRLISIYENKTGLDRDTIAAMVSETSWISVDDALDMGFADSRMELSEVAASFDLRVNNKQKEPDMADKKKAKAEDVKAEVIEEVKTEAVEVEPVEVEETKAEEVEEIVQETVQPEAVEVIEEIKAEESDLKKFTDSFGLEKGAQMLLNGMSFEAAQAEHYAGLEADLKAANEKIAELSEQIEAAKASIGGEPLPLEPVKTEEKKTKSVVTFADSRLNNK